MDGADDAQQLERDLALARRLKVAVRLVVYPLLIGALVLALHIRHAQARANDDPPGAPWHGTGEGVLTADLVVKDDGRVTWARFELPLRCDDGTTTPFTWTPSDLHQDHGVLTARRHHWPTQGLAPGDSGSFDAAVELPLAKGARSATGTISMAETVQRADGRTVVCGGPQAHTFTLTPQGD
jgi:hypothetical protein